MPSETPPRFRRHDFSDRPYHIGNTNPTSVWLGVGWQCRHLYFRQTAAIFRCRIKNKVCRLYFTTGHRLPILKRQTRTRTKTNRLSIRPYRQKTSASPNIPCFHNLRHETDPSSKPAQRYVRSDGKNGLVPQTGMPNTSARVSSPPPPPKS